jgi:hypothetical protein
VLVTPEMAEEVRGLRDNSKLLKDTEGFHQNPVLGDPAVLDAMDGEHSYLHLFAACGNSEPGALVRAVHPELHHDAVALSHNLFDAEAEVGEAGDPARNVFPDRQWAARHCIKGRAGTQLMGYTIGSEDLVRYVQAAFIPQLVYKPMDQLFRIVHRAHFGY